MFSVGQKYSCIDSSQSKLRDLEHGDNNKLHSCQNSKRP